MIRRQVFKSIGTAFCWLSLVSVFAYLGLSSRLRRTTSTTPTTSSSSSTAAAPSLLQPKRIGPTWTDDYTRYTVARLGRWTEPASVDDVVINVDVCRPWNDNETRWDDGVAGDRRRLLVVVVSAAANAAKRRLIRRSWAPDLTASEGPFGASRAALVFLVGSASASASAAVADEGRRHGDVVQVAAQDDYARLTAKSVALLRWSLRHCPGAHLVLKCDDDVYVNVRRLADVVSRVPSLDSLLGSGVQGDRPQRHPDNKYYVSEEVWPWSTYPPYLFGGAYLIGRRAAQRLLAAAAATPHFAFEDVYLTGLCAIKAGVDVLASDRMYERICPKGKLDACFVRHTAAWQTQRAEQLLRSQRAVDDVYGRSRVCTAICRQLALFC